MKHIILIFVIAFSMHLTAQINLEYIYDSASTITSSGPNGAEQSQLIVVKLEVSGERYIKINRWGKNIRTYDSNHSLLKSISMSSFPVNTANATGDVLYFSEHLFNNDDKMEFMYTVATGGGNYYTGIYNEEDSLLFSDIGFPMIRINFSQQQLPIYNTTNGTKMILSYTNKQAKVFSLPGTLSTAIAEANGQLMQQAHGGQGQFSGLYPNPSNGAVTLQYQLPQGEQYGEIVLYNTQGAEVKRYKVDNTFTDILMDNTMLPAGTYFYQLQTAKGAVGVKKSIVVK